MQANNNISSSKKKKKKLFSTGDSYFSRQQWLEV